MEKSNPNLFGAIREKLFSDATLLVSVRLSIAKTLFIFLAFLYFFAYLLVIGGYQVTISRVVVFYLYPLFAFSVIALLYNIIRYAVTIYLGSAKFLIAITFFMLGCAYIWLIGTHVGFDLAHVTPLIATARQYIGF